MSMVAVTRLIEAPVASVWQVFTAVAARPAWLSTVAGVEILTPGPFRAGTSWRETRRLPDGGEITEQFRVRECEPQIRFVVVVPGLGEDFRMTYSFVPVVAGRHRGGTMVTVIQDGNPSAPTRRLRALIFGGVAEETALRRDLDDFAAVA